MKLRATRRDEIQVNLTPLIDVVFLLLIFFMVSTTFNREAEIIVNLPEATSEPQEVRDNMIDITIDKDGNYYVNQKQLINTQLNTLMRAIRAEAKGNADAPLIITADAVTPHQAVVTAMDASRQLGIINISIATRNSSE